MKIDWDKPIKQLLIENGYQPERADHNGQVRMRILKDGKQVHSTPFASVDHAIDLLKDPECKQ